jgi:hypothetical protein
MRFLALAFVALISLVPAIARAEEGTTSRSDSVPNPPQRVRRDPGLFAAGLTMAIAGGLAVNVGGVLVYTADNLCDGVIQGPFCFHDHKDQVHNAGMALLLTGALLIVSGIPIAIAGGRKVPARTQAGLVPVFTF